MSSRSLNKVTLIGNLTRDPELKYTPAGTAVCTFGVATNRSWTTADGHIKEEVQYHRIVAWQKLAELCGKLLTKGRKIFLEGRLVYRTFIGKDNVQRTIAEIVLDDFIVFSDGKRVTATGEEAAASVTPAKVSDDVKAGTSSEAMDDLGDIEKTDVKKSEPVNESVSPDDIPF